MLWLVRGHANFAEYVPMLLVLMAILEFGGGLPAWILHAIGIALVLARVMHGINFGFVQTWALGRFVGTALTFVLLGICGGLCVWQGMTGPALSA